ncbi:MAG: hypothetical protein AABY22_06195 [Nanoarchaeota archaeon]
MENKKNRVLIGRLWMKENENGRYLNGLLDVDTVRTVQQSEVRIVISKTKEKKQENSPDALVFAYFDTPEQKNTPETKKEELL